MTPVGRGAIAIPRFAKKRCFHSILEKAQQNRRKTKEVCWP